MLASNEVLPPGAVVGRYKIRRLLGRGGMGVVYEAEHATLGRVVALKMLVESASSDAAAVARFFQEARAAAGIGHPGIVEVFDLSEPGEQPFLVMEKLEGEELSSYMRRARPLDPRVVASIATELCDAVGAAHRHGIVHRDLKPDNVFLARRGERQDVKVLDFGIAKLGGPGNDLSLTQTGMVMGTPLYMAPEQMRGHPVDARADVYAIGSILFECLSGRTPFIAQSMTEIVVKVTTETAPAVRTFRPDVPPAMEALIAACLDKDPARRPSDANALGAALRAMLTGAPVPVLSPAPAMPPVTRPFTMQSPATAMSPPAMHSVPRSDSSPWLGCGIVASIVALLLAFVVGGGALFWSRARRDGVDGPRRASIEVRPNPPIERVEPRVVEPRVEPPPPEHVLIDRKTRPLASDCAGRYSERGMRARDRYLQWVDPRTGPTGRERNVYGVYALPDNDGRRCASAVEESNALPPSMPELQSAAERYSQALAALAPTLARADRYYSLETYRDDDMQEGRTLHTSLMPQLDAFREAALALSRELETADRRVRSLRIEELAQDPGRRNEYLIERYQEQAMLTVSLARELRLGDDRRFHAEGDAFFQAVEELRVRGDALEAMSGNDSYRDAAREMTRVSLQTMRRVREGEALSRMNAEWIGTHAGWMVEGSPDKMLHTYDTRLGMSYRMP